MLSRHHIAIIGSGPRGLSVLERLAVRLVETPPQRPVDVFLIDAHQVGCGRVWRESQPECYLMNTVADEVSAFSGQPDALPSRPGSGPSLAQWWARQQGLADLPPGQYAPRAVYGRYMQYVLAAIEKALANLPHVRLHKLLDRVVDIHLHAGQHMLTLQSGGHLFADRVVLVTGHACPHLTGEEKAWADAAVDGAGQRYMAGDSAADMPLDSIESGSRVGIVGLGLSFFDVMAVLTEGRGGQYTSQADGSLRYEASGKEPLLYAGSRSGMPVTTRGRNQKHANHRYEPLVFTADRLAAIRQRGQVRFGQDVMPLLMAEINLVYCKTAIRERNGPESEQAFLDACVRARCRDVDGIMAAARACGLHDLAPLDLDTLAYPFTGRRFASPAAFHDALHDRLTADLHDAARGNVDSPVKAALDVIRDTRALIREVVDYGGLEPSSHEHDFLKWYVPRSSSLAAGPPMFRTRQMLALIDAGVLTIVGPDTRISACLDTSSYVMRSACVEGSAVHVKTLVDARIPTPDIRSDTSALTVSLLRQGIWTPFRTESASEATFETGGVAVTGSPYHPIDRQGRPNRHVYVLGIPTEHTRWFMQAGSSRPGFWTDFVRDADAIAADCLQPCVATMAACDSLSAADSSTGSRSKHSDDQPAVVR